MQGRILVVEDDMVTRRIVEEALTAEAYAVATAASYAEARAMLAREEYAIALLDVILPDGDGLALCREIRSTKRTPIIMLTSKSDSADVVSALELGADDYVTKPFDLKILIARIRNQLRRARGEAPISETRIVLGDLVVDPQVRDASVQGKAAGLTQKEFELLHLLARRAGKAVSKETIEQELFEGEVRSDKIIAVYARKVREKIERNPDNPRFLFTVRGFGYRLDGTGS